MPTSGWPDSPILREVAFANLGIGIAGILCWWQHVDNSGPILYTDIIIPVLLLLLLAAGYQARHSKATPHPDAPALKG